MMGRSVVKFCFLGTPKVTVAMVTHVSQAQFYIDREVLSSPLPLLWSYWKLRAAKGEKSSMILF